MNVSRSRFEFNRVRSIKNRIFLFAFFMAIVSLFHIETSSSEVTEKIAVNNTRKNLITPETLDQMEKLPGDLGPLPPVPVPSDNPQTDAKIELGKMLFFDKRLSSDKSMSCATCHDPVKGYSDGLPLSIGLGKMALGRHSPTLLNAAHNTTQLWDGRVSALEEGAQYMIESPEAMNLKRRELADRLNKIPEYKERFQKVFGKEANIENAAKAIASFERTLVTSDAPFDRYMLGDKHALTNEEKRGLALFVGKAVCSKCHSGPNFTDNQFHSLGVSQEGADLGRYSVTKEEKDKWRFRTTPLRNLTQTAPYMHNGSIETLEGVINFYHRGGGSSRFNKSPNMIKLHLTNQEKKELVAFLKTLDGKTPAISMPELPRD